jgi:hypothetical protein
MDAKTSSAIALMAEKRKKALALSDYRNFSKSYIKITNKKGQTVPLEQNYVQQQIHNKMVELRSKGIPPKIIVLKSRQMGVSTDTQGRMIYETCTKTNRNGFIVSQDDDSTSTIFQKAKYMFDNLPDDTKPLQKASNAKELIFDTPSYYKGPKTGLHSKIEIAVAGNARIGRSETRHYVHLSEFALWPGTGENSPDKQLSSIMQSVPDDLDTWVIIESTAKGINHFYELWNDAIKGENGFTPMFFPWMDDITYQIPLQEGDREKLLSTLTEYETYLYNDLKLPLERVKWWRETKKNKCNNDINQMRQENPTTAEEAFIFSGSPVFNSDKIRQRIEVLRQQPQPKRGQFYFEWNNPDIMDIPKKETIRWVDDKNGCIKMYDEVIKGVPYAIGGDTKGEGSDKFAGTVKNNNTGKRVATLHGQMDSKPYTAQMYCMGYYYNIALMGIEINFNTYPIELLTDWKYPKQYLREKTDVIGTQIQYKYGWKTDGNTRPLIIERMVTLIDENIENFVDIDTLQEALTFVKDKNGRPDAMSGKHDDLLLSDMICEGVSGQQTHIVEVVVEKKKSTLWMFNTQEEKGDLDIW